MTEKSATPRPIISPALLASIVDQLACPVCYAGLGLDESRLICLGCRRVYPIVDGIPVLIAEHISE